MSAIDNLHKSAKGICKSCPQVMVFGFEHCNYTRVRNWLTPPPSRSPFKIIWNYELGDPRITHKTLENTTISKIDVPLDSAQFPRICKAAITNLVFENYRRIKSGTDPIIPLLLCIDIDDNPHPLKAQNLTTKGDLNAKLTHKELRRCYKLSEEFYDSELREVAKATFKFVKVKKDGNLELIDPPWMDKNWKQLWDERIKSKKPSESESSISVSSWRKHLAEKLSTLGKSSITYNSSSSSSSTSSSSSSHCSSSSSSFS